MSVEPIMVEPIEKSRSTGYLEADRDIVPDQFEYVEPKKSAGEYYITK